VAVLMIIAIFRIALVAYINPLNDAMKGL